MNKRFDTILFDLDGTLFNTADTILNSLKATVKELGLRKLTEDEINSFIGPPVVASLKRFYPFMTDEEVDNATKAYRAYYIEHELLKADLFPGMDIVLTTLKENDYKVALATYKLMKCVTILFDYKDVSKYFDSIRGSVAETGQTKTDIMKQAMDDCNVSDLNKVCMIGDTEHDLRGAINLNIPFLGVRYGAGFKGLTDEEKNYDKFVGMCDKPIDILKFV